MESTFELFETQFRKMCRNFMAETKLYSQDFGVKSWIFFIIGTSIVYVEIKLCTKSDSAQVTRSVVPSCASEKFRSQDIRLLIDAGWRALFVRSLSSP